MRYKIKPGAKVKINPNVEFIKALLKTNNTVDVNKIHIVENHCFGHFYSVSGFTYILRADELVIIDDV